jgi:hypothetical protein
MQHLVHDHKYGGEWIESLMPFERDIYIDMLVSKLDKDQEEALQG